MSENRNSYFDGGLLGLIGMRIVTTLLTIITLGFGAPWAVCIMNKWKIEHIVINGRRLKFNGKGGELFRKYIIWALLTIVTIGIYGFWLQINMKKFVVSHTVFEDNMESASLFDGKLIQLIGYNILCFLLVLLTLGICTPFAVCIKEGWTAKHTVINGKRLAFDGHGIQLIGKQLLWTLLTLITIGIYGLWIPIKYIKWTVSHEFIDGEKSI